MAGPDAADPFSRTVPLAPQQASEPQPVIGVPRAEDLRFFGDALQEKAYHAALAQLEGLGAKLVPVDFTAFFETAALLYEGPWVAERHAAIAAFLKSHAASLHPVTRAIISGAEKFDASTLFRAQYRLAELKLATRAHLAAGEHARRAYDSGFAHNADLAADPIVPNSRCGTYTNFVNLLDLAACAAPGRSARMAARRASLSSRLRARMAASRRWPGLPSGKRGDTRRDGSGPSSPHPLR